MLKYIGNEHYCPLSLLRVYGITEVEEYDDENHDDDNDDDITLAESTTANKSAAAEGGYFDSAKKAVVGLVNNVAETFTGSGDSGKQNKNETSQKTAGSDIVTHVTNPDHMVDYLDDVNFISMCIQRTWYSEYNSSLNPIFRFGLSHVLVKRKCPSLQLFSSLKPPRYCRRTKANLRDTGVKQELLRPIPPPPLNVLDNMIPKENTNKKNGENKDDKKTIKTTTSLDCNKKDTVTPVTADVNNNKVTETFKTTSETGSDKQQQQQQQQQQGGVESLSVSPKNEVDATARGSVVHEVATTNSGQRTGDKKDDTTCSKLVPPTIDITELIPQPSFIDSLNTVAHSSQVEATAALKAVDLHEKESFTTTSLEKIATGKESSVQRQLVSITSSAPITTSSSSPEKHVDVLEFKTDMNTDKTTSMIAKKVEEPSEEKIASLSNNTTVEAEVKKVDLEDHPETISPSSEPPILVDLKKGMEHSQSLVREDILSISHPVLPSSQILSTDRPSLDVIMETLASSTRETSSIEQVQPNKAKEAQQATTMMTSGLPGSKESIIVKLNAKIKALQMNLTMSMMYLEDMSEK